jgi:hypothetical protein
VAAAEKGRDVKEPLTAEDVRHARLDRDAFGRVHPEIKYAVCLQIFRNLHAAYQIPSTAKALIEETLSQLGEKL